MMNRTVLKKIIPAFAAVLVCFGQLAAQSIDSLTIEKKADTPALQYRLHSRQSNNIRITSFIIPAAMFTYGVMAINNGTLRDFNKELRDEVYLENPHAKFHLDNYLQFAPAVAVYGLNAAGVHGRYGLLDRSMVYVMSNVFLNITVSSIKKISHQLRPDSTSYESFPSGHTAEAFASAEFMRMEYRDVSVWYGVAGYAMAFATGYLRMYNNKHWFSDVVAGAGVGIISTRLSYLLYPAIQRALFKKRMQQSVVYPSYQNGVYTLGLVHYF